MSVFTLDELVPIIRDAAGDLEVSELDEHIGQTTFLDLGLDSLAVMELTSLLKRTVGVVIPEGDVRESNTPGELVDEVNSLLKQSVRA